MSFFQLGLSKLPFAELGARILRNGEHAAIITPFRRLKSRDTPTENAFIGWDLIQQEHRVRASGARILHLFGEVLSFEGHPVPGAVVEIRQCDLGPHTPTQKPSTGFLGIGRTITDFEGRYQFRTILPVADQTGSAFIDAQITPPNGRSLATRLYLLNNNANDKDWNYRALGPARQAAVSLDPVKRHDGDWDAGFNFVL